MRVCGGIVALCALAFAGARLAFAMGTPTPSFSYSPAAPVAGDTVQFTNESKLQVTTDQASYGWNFDDNRAFSTEENPSHVFGTAGTYTVTLTASEIDQGTTLSSTTTAAITVAAPQVGPAPDSYSTGPNSSLSIDAASGLLVNDAPTSTQTGKLSTVSETAVATAKGGTIDVGSDGSFTYAPPSDFLGDDTFTYRTVDSAGVESDPVTVTVAVHGILAAPDSYTVSSAAATTVSVDRGVLTNDSSNVDGTLTALGGAVSVAHGRVSLGSDGSFTYTPDGSGFTGQDSFTYVAQAGNFRSSETTVTLDVAAPAPANDDFANAIALSGTGGTESGSNVGATTETGEPNTGSTSATVWWSWKAPSTGTYTFSTEGSTDPNNGPLDTVLGVYTGTSVSGLSEREFDDDNGTDGKTSVVRLEAVADTIYYIQVGSHVDTTQGSIQLQWSALVPTNDDFANARLLTGDAGGVDGTTLGATVESVDPEGTRELGETVWYVWTPDASTKATLVFSGSFAGAIGVYTGDTPGSLEETTFAAASSTETGSSGVTATFAAVAGTTYHIEIGTQFHDPGPFSLAWVLNVVSQAGVVLDDGAGGTPLEGATVTLLNSDHNPVGEPPLSSATPVNPETTGTTGSWAWIVQPGSYEVRAEKDGCGTASAPVTLAEGSDPADITLHLSCASAPANDDFANAQTLGGDSGSVDGSTVNATLEDGEPSTASSSGGTVWYAWTPSASGRATFGTGDSGVEFNVYAGDTLDALELLASGGAGVTIDVQTDTIYYVQVGAMNSSVSFTLSWSLAPTAPPGNDDFANATAVSGASGTATGSNVSASVEEGEPTSDSQVSTVWWKWTAPSTGTFAFSTEGSTPAVGSAFDTVLAVYTGSSLATLDQVAVGDNNQPYELTSAASFAATEGTTYFVQVGGHADASEGTIQLAWSSAPDNDDWANAVALPAQSTGSVTGTSVGATNEDGEPFELEATETYDTVWWKWTAPASGAFEFDTVGSTMPGESLFDTVLGVFTGTALDSLTEIGSDDDSGLDGNLSSMVVFDAVAGTTYYLQVGGFEPEYQGTVKLNWGLASVPNDDFANAAALEGPSGSVDASLLGATREDGEPDPFFVVESSPLENTAWYTWTPTESGNVDFTLGSDFVNALAVYTGDGLSSLDPVDFQHATASSPAVDFASSGDSVRTLLQASSFDWQTSIEFEAQAGTTYFVQVGTYDDSPGPFALDWTQAEAPANDALADAVTLSGQSGTIGGTTAGATVDSDAGEQTQVVVDDVNHDGAHSVWYRWQPTVGGDAEFTLAPDAVTEGAVPVGLVQLYSGPAADLGYGDLEPVGTHSDGEHLTATVTAGSTYYVQVMADAQAETSQDFDFTLAWTASVREISGRVLAADGSAASGSLVRACAGGDCTDTKARDDGDFSFTGLDARSYVVRAYPSDPSALAVEKTIDVTDGSADGVDFRFIAVASASTASGPTTFTVSGCAGGTLHYTVSDGSSTLGSGDVADGGSGTYAIDLSSLALGHRETLRFALEFDCPGGTQSSTAILFTDPSGTVVDDDAGGAALAGATVTLLDADGNAIPAGDTRLSKATAANPETSDARGAWGWDVAPGVYRVRAEKDGCGTATTGALAVSPDDPATGIVLHLSCGTTTTTTTSGSGAPPPPPFPTTPPSPPSPPLPDPVEGVNANSVPVAGTVLVNGVPLVAGEQIPFGATVDTTQGIVSLTTIGPTGEKQTAYFFGGVFKVVQGADGATELVLSQGDFGVCTPTGTEAAKTTRHVSSASAKKPPKPKKGKKHATKTKKPKKGAPGTARGIAAKGKPRSSKIVRSLWGTGKGSFRTKGRYSAATVRGTLWFTADRCDGTYTQVNDGVVEVQDEVRNLVLTVAAGHSVLVRPKNG